MSSKKIEARTDPRMRWEKIDVLVKLRQLESELPKLKGAVTREVQKQADATRDCVRMSSEDARVLKATNAALLEALEMLMKHTKGYVGNELVLEQVRAAIAAARSK